MKITNYIEAENQIVKNIYIGEYKNSLIFEFKSGNGLLLSHDQDCCEYVAIDDIIGGDLKDLIGQEILKFEEVVSRELEDEPVNMVINEALCSSTWTFYKISTLKDDITIRWYGASNGHYSEKVDVEYIEDSDRLKNTINIYK